MLSTLTTHLLAADEVKPSGSDARLITAAVVGVVVIIAAITWLKVHPFLALTIGALGVGIGAGLPAADAVTSFSTGFGTTMGSVGVLVGLGAMFGKLLADSGGADRIVDTLVARSSTRALPWTMALVGAIIGLPMFFEIGLVLMMPIIILTAKRSGAKLMTIAIPTLAGLSVMHGLVPPHPGPLVAVTTLKANLGLTLAIGIVIAIPTVIVAGPLFAKFAARWVDVPVPTLFLADRDDDETPPGGGGGNGGQTKTAPDRTEQRTDRPTPSFLAALLCILLPVLLMLAKAVTDVVAPDADDVLAGTLNFLGTPLIALAIAVVVGMLVLGRAAGMSRGTIQKTLERSLPPIAGILLIVGAGGGFKQVLIDTGIGQVIANAVEDSGLSVLLLAWIVAAVIRVATGSATVAIVTASGILAPLAADLSTPQVSLMVLAVGAGSLFLSHVNDAGFWLVKEYLGTSVPETLKTWTVMECVISVTGLIGVLIANLIV